MNFYYPVRVSDAQLQYWVESRENLVEGDWQPIGAGRNRVNNEQFGMVHEDVEHNQ